MSTPGVSVVTRRCEHIVNTPHTPPRTSELTPIVRVARMGGWPNEDLQNFKDEWIIQCVRQDVSNGFLLMPRVGGASLGDQHQLVTIGASVLRHLGVDADITDSNCWLFWEMTLRTSHVQAPLRHSRAEPVACVLVTIPRSPVTGPRHDYGHKMMIVNLWWPYLFWNEFIFWLFGRQLYWANRENCTGCGLWLLIDLMFHP